MVVAIIALVVCVCMGVVIIRAIIGPTPYDRILAANMFGGQTVALIVLLSVLLDDVMILDIAIIYALINFIATVGFLRFFKYKTFNDDIVSDV